MAPRILIVEDNLLVAMLLADLLEQCGCETAGPVGTVAAAIAAAERNDVDGAILDINLGDERVWPAAEFLEERSVPFIISTGYGKEEVPERFRRYDLLPKPASLSSLARVLNNSGITAPRDPPKSSN